MLLSIVVPAFNEEGYLGETLASLNRARAFLQREWTLEAEIIVVDNDSDDSTADVALALGGNCYKRGATQCREGSQYRSETLQQ